MKGCFSKTKEKYDNYLPPQSHPHLFDLGGRSRGSPWLPGRSGTDPRPGNQPQSNQPPEEPAHEQPPPPEAAEDGFYGIGSELGYESSTLGAMQPNEVRTVGLNGVIAQATTALVAVTTRAGPSARAGFASGSAPRRPTAPE